jgi:hypothetical protein
LGGGGVDRLGDGSDDVGEVIAELCDWAEEVGPGCEVLQILVCVGLEGETINEIALSGVGVCGIAGGSRVIGAGLC